MHPPQQGDRWRLSGGWRRRRASWLLMLGVETVFGEETWQSFETLLSNFMSRMLHTIHCRGHSRGNGGLLYDCIRFSRREQLSERETHHTQRIRPPVSRWRRKLLRSSWRPRGFHKCFTSPYVTISFIGIISTSMEIINHIKLTMKIDSLSRPDGDSNPGPPHYECRS